MNKEILKHYYDEGKKFGYALARGATDLPSVQTFDELYTEQLNKPLVYWGVEETRDGYKQRWEETIFRPELTDADILGWLKSKKYQTSQMEQEYRGYYDVDMPKIIRDAISELG